MFRLRQKVLKKMRIYLGDGRRRGACHARNVEKKASLVGSEQGEGVRCEEGYGGAGEAKVKVRVLAWLCLGVSTRVRLIERDLGRDRWIRGSQPCPLTKRSEGSQLGDGSRPCKMTAEELLSYLGPNRSLF
jgi:hypothetical protein